MLEEMEPGFGLLWKPMARAERAAGCVERARDHLMLREFSQCLRLCHRGIEEGKGSSDSSMALIQVDLSVLAIQAYAELDQWEEVLPFVDSVFKGIQHSPVIIIKLCIALLASVGEFDRAHNQALVWLYEPSNQLDAKQYTAVGQFLIEKVFLPQRKLEAIGILLDNLPAIPQQEKVAIKKMLKNVRLTKKKSEQPLVKPELKEFVMITLLRKIGCFLLNRLPPFITNNIHKVSLISFSILLILFHLKTGYASLAGFNVGTLIWRQVLDKTFTSS